VGLAAVASRREFLEFGSDFFIAGLGSSETETLRDPKNVGVNRQHVTSRPEDQYHISSLVANAGQGEQLSARLLGRLSKQST